jgi:hypothetical protein
MSSAKRSNRSFDADTQRHCAARRAGERTPRGAMPLRAGQLQRYSAASKDLNSRPVRSTVIAGLRMHERLGELAHLRLCAC